MRMRAAFAALRWRIIRHGPNDERGFGLVTGLLAAAGVVVLAVLGRDGTVHPSWMTAAVSAFGLMWLLGPVLLPGSAPVLDPQWFRTLPRRPAVITREMAPSEAISVGTVVTAVALAGLVVLAAPHGAGAVVVAVVAALAQLHFLLWLGRCASAAVARMLRTSVGMWLTALQMSVLLAISFAGWVPIVALVLPDMGEGSAEIVTPAVGGAVPVAVERVLLVLPTGWSLAALEAVTSSASLLAVLLPVVGLFAVGTGLRMLWIALTAYTLRRPPARAQSNVTAKRAGFSRSPGGGPVRAVTSRELTTWFRDPHRKLGLGHAWLTPLLMIALVAPTTWDWALPFIGVMAAVLGAMVAVNTYALDGTALWQLLTVPGAVRADVRGRYLAWLQLFGLPVLALTVLLCLVSGSPLWAVALGMTLAATGAACACAPLFGAMMPAIGADARERVSPSSHAGNPAGGQWTIFAAVIAVAVVPVVLTQLVGAGSLWPVPVVLGAAIGLAALLGLAPLTRRYLERRGPELLAAMESDDLTRLTRPGQSGQSGQRSLSRSAIANSG
ncbi:hypothetical protein [Georgenia deserti]|uniref:ABC-2 type transport system permease protein n=1 Tax=Georgenia deserti TaxID=2093781 RepID=A0ABW4L4T6_9MICO